jgi:hypothetical protein
VTEPAERRTNIALRGRIDHLLAHVRAAREDIVERGLSAVEKPPAGGPADAARAVRLAKAARVRH